MREREFRPERGIMWSAPGGTVAGTGEGQERPRAKKLLDIEQRSSGATEKRRKGSRNRTPHPVVNSRLRIIAAGRVLLFCARTRRCSSAASGAFLPRS